MTIEQHREPTRTAGDRTIAIYVARFAVRANARHGEDLLGRLCGDGDLDVLDGAMVDWPPDAPAPVWRPLQNLPRLAALTHSAWTEALHRPPESDEPALIPPLAAVARDHSTIIAICDTPSVARVHDELSRTGASVRATTISAERYTELRSAYRSG